MSDAPRSGMIEPTLGSSRSPVQSAAGGDAARLTVPESLQLQIDVFRRHVWSSKLFEAIVASLVVGVTAFLLVYLSDRMWDTPRWLRGGVLLVALAGWMLVPLAVYRWVWRRRTLHQLARLLRQRDPQIGDQLLSVIELAENDSEQARSRTLCAAAIRQVAVSARQRDLTAAAPPHMGRSLAAALAVTALIAVGLGVVYPAAAGNAWARFSQPWSSTGRFTFTIIEPLPTEYIVPHGEQVTMRIQLDPRSHSLPGSGYASLAQHKAIPVVPVDADRRSDRSSSGLAFELSLPALTSQRQITIRLGDDSQTVQVVPKLRPELTTATAVIEMPSYLQRTDSVRQDVRSGVLNVLTGSTARLDASVSRSLHSATANGLPAAIEGADIHTHAFEIEPPPVRLPVDYAPGSFADKFLEYLSEEQRRDLQLPDPSTRSTADQPKRGGERQASEGSRDAAIASRAASSDLQREEQRLEVRWIDEFGLEPRDPFELTVNPVLDQLPTVLAQGLPRQSVVLESQQLNFEALAADDFGIRAIGIAWSPASVERPESDKRFAEQTTGQKSIAAGDPHRTSLQTPATFSANSLGITPQTIDLRLWVEDYASEHLRVYSPSHRLFILSADEHAAWISDQLSKWQRMSLEVRDAELQLFEANKRLRDRVASDPADPQLQQDLRRQASLEATNARRLEAITQSGQQLLQQAVRNPEIDAGSLNAWAKSLEVLSDIGQNRMPSVADLLGRSANERRLRSEASSEDAAASLSDPSQQPAPSVGIDHSTSSSTTSSEQDKQSPTDNDVAEDAPPQLPSISDIESSMQGDAVDASKNSEDRSSQTSANSKLSLPQTTLRGPANDGQEESAKGDENDSSSDDNALQQALFEQEELLAEFERVSGELQRLLANLEGSTMVKRLKAASRRQIQIADRISERIAGLFGASRAELQQSDSLEASRSEQARIREDVSYIMDDMQSYYERRRIDLFKLVLDDMQESDVLLHMQELAEDLSVHPAVAIAQAEYWADSLDRWAEDLVESGEASSSSDEESESSSDALPPELIVRMLRLLEGEVDLREATRETEQAMQVIGREAHQQSSTELSQRQAELRQQSLDTLDLIDDLDQGASRFATEIDLLANVSAIMREAEDMLAEGATGAATVGAETDVIEMLLQSTRVNPQAGSSGGASSSGEPGSGSTGDTDASALAMHGSRFNQSERREYREVNQATGESGRAFPEEYRAGLDLYFQRLEQRQGK